MLSGQKNHDHHDLTSNSYLDHFPLPTWIVNAENFSIIRVNKAAVVFTGHDQHECSSLCLDQILVGKIQLSFLINKAIGSSVDGILKKKSGAQIPVQLYASEIFYDGQRFFQLTAVPVHKESQRGNELF